MVKIKRGRVLRIIPIFSSSFDVELKEEKSKNKRCNEGRKRRPNIALKRN